MCQFSTESGTQQKVNKDIVIICFYGHIRVNISSHPAVLQLSSFFSINNFHTGFETQIQLCQAFA